MKLWKFTLEYALYLSIFALAGILRFAALGHAGVSDEEAALALQAYHMASGSVVPLDAHAIYLLPTTMMMFFFGASNFAARFWPAVAGSALVLLPYFIKDWVGKRAAIVLAVLLAIDPSLLGASRAANSTMITLTALLFALVFWYRKQSILTGIFSGLSLLGGPQLWPGVLSLGLTGWLASLWKLWNGSFSPVSGDPEVPERSFSWRKALGVGLATFLIVGSLLLLVPQGIGVGFGSLPGYIKGWTTPSNISVGMLFNALWAYEALVLFLSLVGIIRAIRQHDAIDKILGIWLGISLVLALVYPGKQMFDLLWCVPPMLTLTARQLVRMIEVPESDRLITAGEAILVVILLAFMIYTGVSWRKSVGAPVDTTWPLVKLGVSIFLILAVVALIGWGWNARLAMNGLAGGIAILLAAMFVSGAFHAAGFSRYPETELMQTGPGFVDSDLLRLSIQNYSEWKPDSAQLPAITVVGLPSPALEWELRNFKQIQYVQSLVQDSRPEMMVTPENMALAMTAAYRGTGLFLTKTPAWSLLSPQEWMRWFIYRSVPEDGMSYQKIILWVRSDIFPGGAGTPETTGTP